MAAAALVLTLVLGAVDYGIVLENGRMIRVAEAPVIDGNVVLSRLADGTLVSLSRSRVDWPETTAANRAAEARAGLDHDRPRPRARLTRTVSNRTIEEFARNEPPRAVPPSGEAAGFSQAAPSSVTPARVELPPDVDDLGNGPGYWRERARILAEDTRALERAVASTRTQLRAEQDALLYGQVMGSASSPVKIVRYGLTPEEIALNRLRISELEERLLEREAALAEARAREADLKVEAREAGADPGWVRVAASYR